MVREGADLFSVQFFGVGFQCFYKDKYRVVGVRLGSFLRFIFGIYVVCGFFLRDVFSLVGQQLSLCEQRVGKCVYFGFLFLKYFFLEFFEILRLGIWRVYTGKGGVQAIVEIEILDIWVGFVGSVSFSRVQILRCRDQSCRFVLRKRRICRIEGGCFKYLKFGGSLLYSN